MSLLFDYYRHHDGAPFLGWLFFLVVVVALAGIAAWVVSGLAGRRSAASPQPPAPPGVDPALSALRLRYARGELSRDEFLRAAADLGAPPPLDVPPAA